MDVIVRGYLRFVPATAITWVLVDLVAPQVPKGPTAARAGLLIASLGLYTAAAASLHGGKNENPVWLGLERASGAIDLFLIGLALSVVAGIGLGAGVAVGGDAAIVSFSVVSGLLDLALLSRLWPALAIPYLYEGRTVWSPSARGSFRSGPGLATAWRMTGRAGTFVRVSAPVMATSLVLVAIPVGIRLVRGTGFWDGLLLYGAVLPFVSTLVLLSAEPLVVDVR
jgi:hypothetical protein